MDGTTEKIYCMDHSSDAALMSALANNNTSGTEMAALMSNNNWLNNPFIYLVWMMFAQNFWGRNGVNAADGAQTTAENYNSRQIAALQDTVNTNHNNDLAMQAINGNTAAVAELAQTFNTNASTMQLAISGVKSSIDLVAGQIGSSRESVINSVLLGNKDLTQTLQSCCCENKLLTTTQGYENRIATLNQTNALQAGQTGIANAINDARTALANGISTGFASTAYETQRQTCDVLNNNNANTQKIIDTLNNHWVAESSQALQDAKFEISQLKQNQYLINSLGGSCSCNA